MKATQSTNHDTEYVFSKFEPDSRSISYKQLNIDRIKTYLSFMFTQKPNFCSYVSTKNTNFYKVIRGSTRKVKEKRITKISIKAKEFRLAGDNTMKAINERYEEMEKLCD